VALLASGFIVAPPASRQSLGRPPDQGQFRAARQALG
jgi:hypothetical protein